jgi:hypothetical protein
MTKFNRLIPWVTLAALPFLLGAGCVHPLALASDRRLKRDITKVGPLDGDIDLYRYRYLWSDREYVGVIAQDLLEVRPDAVIRGADGYLRVDYAALGSRMQTWEEWRRANG